MCGKLAGSLTAGHALTADGGRANQWMSCELVSEGIAVHEATVVEGSIGLGAVASLLTRIDGLADAAVPDADNSKDLSMSFADCVVRAHCELLAQNILHF